MEIEPEQMNDADKILHEIQLKLANGDQLGGMTAKLDLLMAGQAQVHEQLKELRNPQTRQETKEVSPGDISRGNLQRRLHTILTLAAGDGNEPEVATKIHAFFRTLEETQHAS